MLITPSRLFLIGTLALAGCHTFLDIDARRCGNKVHEPSANEDCDGPIGQYACGAPGTVNACRLLCAEDGRCPEGWACGVDGVCRAPSGRIETAHIASIEGAVMELADLDGDGLTDLLVQDRTTLRYAYGEAGGTFSTPQTLTVPSTNIPAAVGDVDGDGIDDVTLLFVEGLQIFRGTPNRLLVPVSAVDTADVTPPQRMISVHARAPFEVADLLTVTETPRGSVLGILEGTLDTSALDTTGSLATRVAVADFDTSEAPTEDEIALGFVGAPHIDVARIRCAETCALEIAHTLPLPDDGVVNERGTHAGDIDGDGLTDLLAAITMAGGAAIAVAYGTPDGFEPFAVDLRFAEVAGCVDCMGVQAGLRALSNVAHINSPRASIASGFAIYDVPEEGPLELLYFPRRPLGGIGFADLNGDGIQDAYGNLAGALVYLLANPQRQMTHHDTPISNFTHVVPGDYDGDGRLDLAIASATGEVRVVFSEFNGPQKSVLVTQLQDPVVSMQRARLLTPQHRQLDGADELIVYTASRRYIFQGSAERRPWAPVRLGEFPRELAVGNFGDGLPGVFIGLTARLAQPEQVFFGEDLPTESLRPVTVNNCGEGLRSTLAISRTIDYGGERNAVLTVEVTIPTQDAVTQERRVRILALQGEIGRCVFNSSVSEVGRPDSVALGDLDGDGTDDLVLGTGRDAIPMVGLVGVPRLVYWRGDEGRYAETFEVLDRATPQPAITALRLADNQQRRVVGIADDVVAALRVEDGVLTHEPLARAPAGALQMRAGDIDGDGVEDLLIKTASSVIVMRQTACSALETTIPGSCTRPPIE